MLAQMLLFGTVGAVNTGIDVGAYLALTRLMTLDPVAANALSFMLGSLNGYVMNGRVTFRERATRLSSASRLARYLLVLTVTLATSTALMFVLVGPLDDLLAKLVVTACTFLVGFSLSRGFVYGADLP